MTQQINNAILGMNKSYQSAISGLQPYTQTGVEALDKLNQYIGLSPYKPAQAPTAPTLQDAWKDLDMRNLSMQALNLMPKGQLVNSGSPAGSEKDESWQHWNVGSTAAQLASNPESYKSLAAQNFLSNFMAAGGSVGGGGLAEVIDARNQRYKQQYDLDTTKYNQDLANYNQDMAWAEQYGTPLTADQVTQNITSTPGYSAELGQGVDAIGKLAGAGGYIGSGRALKELMNFGQNTLSKYYNNTLNQLGQIAGSGQNAATNAGQFQTQYGNNLANLYSSLGENQANSILAGANARSQALTAANQQYDVIGQQSSGGGGLGGLGSLLGGVASKAGWI